MFGIPYTNMYNLKFKKHKQKRPIELYKYV